MNEALDKVLLVHHNLKIYSENTLRFYKAFDFGYECDIVIIEYIA